ncbi:hypothetical protein PUN28_014290 [Cardiocondyla obscurior]|uniref:Transposase n=1 Tax=Cardiocondyla obscurior TaxID=286306 RepID=A0AAW2F314_9HYME
MTRVAPIPRSWDRGSSNGQIERSFGGVRMVLATPMRRWIRPQSTLTAIYTANLGTCASRTTASRRD